MIEIHYNNPATKFEIIKFTFNREVAILSPSWVTNKDHQRRSTRNFRCHNANHVDVILQNIVKAFKDPFPFNMYYSIAKYQDGLPKFSPNLQLRDTSQWNKEHYLHMTSYDFFIDIDAPDHSNVIHAHDDAIRISAFLNTYNVPYELRFSGCGFHIIIPHEYFETLHKSFDPNKENNIYTFYKQLAIWFSDQFTEFIDLNVYDSRRLCKLPYTIVQYENLNVMCLPFTSNEAFLNFKILDAYIENIPYIRGRGTRVFNNDPSKWDCKKLLKYTGVMDDDKRTKKGD